MKVATHIREPLPAVRGDRERLRQLLLNLVTNAAKYTVAGDEIEVRAGAEDGQVLVTVLDHGPGIPADQHRFIFEKFGRVNSGGRFKPGAGSASSSRALSPKRMAARSTFNLKPAPEAPSPSAFRSRSG